MNNSIVKHWWLLVLMFVVAQAKAEVAVSEQGIKLEDSGNPLVLLPSKLHQKLHIIHRMALKLLDKGESKSVHAKTIENIRIVGILGSNGSMKGSAT